jgi:hypothetical protein
MGKGSGSINKIPYGIKTANQNFGEKLMKITIKILLVTALFFSTAFADGDMGNGGYTGCTQNCDPPACRESCREMPAPVKTSDRIIIFLSKYIVKGFI